MNAFYSVIHASEFGAAIGVNYRLEPPARWAIGSANNDPIGCNSFLTEPL